MVGRALADTSALLALAFPKDQYHVEAVRTARRYLRSGGRFVSTPLVLAELHGHLLYRGGHATATRVAAAMLQDPAYQWISVDVELLATASSAWLERFQDQDFTLCDAVSFAVMRQANITTAFAYDHHFEVAGFKRL